MDINYDKLLDDWAEVALKKSDDINEISKGYESFSYGQGRLEGIAIGYIEAVALLNRMEKKWKR